MTAREKLASDPTGRNVGPWVGGFIKQLVGNQQRSLSSRFILPRRGRPLIAGKEFVRFFNEFLAVSGA